MKVYCINCKHFAQSKFHPRKSHEYFVVSCQALANLGNWKSPTQPKLGPENLNKENRCTHYEEAKRGRR